MFKIILLICMCIHVNSEDTINEPVKNKDFVYNDNLVESIKLHLENFNNLYITNLDKKLMSILATITTLEAHMQVLQEKANVWNIFHHHIDAWTNHIISVDHKLDLLKRSQEGFLNVENKIESFSHQITQMSYNIDQITYKFDNFKMDNHENVKTKLKNCEIKEKSLITNKLRIIEHKLNEKKHFTNDKDLRKNENLCPNNLKQFLDNITKLTNRLNHKCDSNNIIYKNIEHIDDLSSAIDERTLRIFDSLSFFNKNQITCCTNTAHELSTFTNSADILLKRIEHVVIDVSRKLEIFNENHRNHLKTYNRDDVDEKENESDYENGSGADFGSGTSQPVNKNKELLYLSYIKNFEII